MINITAFCAEQGHGLSIPNLYLFEYWISNILIILRAQKNTRRNFKSYVLALIVRSFVENQQIKRKCETKTKDRVNIQNENQNITRYYIFEKPHVIFLPLSSFLFDPSINFTYFGVPRVCNSRVHSDKFRHRGCTPRRQIREARRAS